MNELQVCVFAFSGLSEFFSRFFWCYTVGKRSMHTLERTHRDHHYIGHAAVSSWSQTLLMLTVSLETCYVWRSLWKKKILHLGPLWFWEFWIWSLKTHGAQELAVLFGEKAEFSDWAISVPSGQKISYEFGPIRVLTTMMCLPTLATISKHMLYYYS